jgi:23S rRNA (adenine2030-N6)-methyltransferase
MNYRHAFHAGNFADVFKHLVLSSLLKKMREKDKPFSYVETHAGKGRYDLRGDAARRTGEAQEGVLRLVQSPELPPDLLGYLQLVCKMPGNEQGIRWYPGSPLIAQALLRDQDRAILVELHPEEAAELRRNLGHDRRFGVHCRDGWEALGALLPPTPRRGVLLVDPPFERSDEFEQVFAGLDQVEKRWGNATVAVWYPIKRGTDLEPVYRRLAGGAYSDVLRIEFCLHPDDTPARLNGTGVFILRPPWKLDRDIEGWLPALGPALTGAPAFRYCLDWLAAPP